MNRTLMERARSMSDYKNVDKKYWAEALNIETHINNRLPNLLRRDQTPYEVVFSKKPDFAHYIVFGSTGYAYLDETKRSKLESKAFPMIFLVYAEDVKGYRGYSSQYNKPAISRTIRFQEEGNVKWVYEQNIPNLKLMKQNIPKYKNGNYYIHTLSPHPLWRYL